MICKNKSAVAKEVVSLASHLRQSEIATSQLTSLNIYHAYESLKTCKYLKSMVCVM
jgi:hypothetical protein